MTTETLVPAWIASIENRRKSLGQFVSPILVRPLVYNGGTSRAFEVIGYAMLGLCVVFFVGAMRVRRTPATI